MSTQFFPLISLLFLLLCLKANATPTSVGTDFAIHKRFNSRILGDVQLRFVEDSGICETTAGVHQVSGYIDVGKNMSMV